MLQMRGEFANGDLVVGVKRGLAMLALAARAPRTLHAAT